MTYPSYGGRLLSPADLARLERYRQLIAASALRQPQIPQPSPLSREAPAPWNTADGILDTFGAGAKGDSAVDPQAHLLTASLHSPGSPRQHSAATQVHLPWTRESQAALYDFWKRLNDALRPYADIKPGFMTLPLPGVRGFVPAPGGAIAVPPIPFPGGTPDWPGADVVPPILPGPAPRPLVRPRSGSGEAPVPVNVPPRDSGFIPEPVGPTMLTGPDLFGKALADLLLKSNPDGSRGKKLTEKSNDILIEECMDIGRARFADFHHIGGGTPDGKGGKAVPETYIPRGAAVTDEIRPNYPQGIPPTAGSNRSDGSFQRGYDDIGGADAKTAHFNTTTMKRSGEMTTKEANALGRLKMNLRSFGDGIVRAFSHPKLRSLDPDDVRRYREEARALCEKLVDSLADKMSDGEIIDPAASMMSPY